MSKKEDVKSRAAISKPEEVKLRSPMLIIASGMQEIGKSYRTLAQLLYQAYKSKTKRQSLIFDTNNEYGDYECEGKILNIKTIYQKDIIPFGNSRKYEIRRLVPYHPDGRPMSPEESEKLLIYAIENYRGGTLFIEDLNKIYGDSLPQSISGLLCNVRHRNCDVVFHLQSIGRLLPKMRQNCKIIRYHYQLDSIEDSKDKLAGEIEIYRIAEKLVNKEFEKGGDHRYFFVYIYREIKKIKGMFSPRMLAEAIGEYISETPSATRTLLLKRDAAGKKMYNYEQAVKIKTEELFKRYWGN